MIYINVNYGYPWQKGKLREDSKYCFLRDIAAGSIKAVSGMKSAENIEVRVHQSRLRVLHGAHILDDIRRRIQAADVLLFDLEERNANVMLELGIALADPIDGPKVFILMPENDSIPSDLSGYLVTKYRETDEYSLVDPLGFQAALRSALKDRVRRKGVNLSWGSALDSDDETVETSSEP